MQPGQMPMPQQPQAGGEIQQIMQALGLTEEDLAALFESGVSGERMGMLGDQMGMADQLRNTAAPEMRQAGRVQVASNPLEMLGAGLSRIKGQKDMEGLMGERSSLIDALRKGNRTGGMMAMRDRFGAPGSMLEPLEEEDGIPALLRRPQF